MDHLQFDLSSDADIQKTTNNHLLVGNLFLAFPGVLHVAITRVSAQLGRVVSVVSMKQAVRLEAKQRMTCSMPVC
jgi:hypothetical protein